MMSRTKIAMSVTFFAMLMTAGLPAQSQSCIDPVPLDATAETGCCNDDPTPSGWVKCAKKVILISWDGANSIEDVGELLNFTDEDGNPRNPSIEDCHDPIGGATPIPPTQISTEGGPVWTCLPTLRQYFEVVGALVRRDRDVPTQDEDPYLWLCHRSQQPCSDNSDCPDAGDYCEVPAHCCAEMRSSDSAFQGCELGKTSTKPEHAVMLTGYKPGLIENLRDKCECCYGRPGVCSITGSDCRVDTHCSPSETCNSDCPILKTGGYVAAQSTQGTAGRRWRRTL